MNPEHENILKDIKIVITDVDGVLTDGGLYYTDEGLVMKKFNVKDGMGVVRLRKAGIKTGLISTDTSKLMEIRAARLHMDYIYTGVWDKENRMREICAEMGIGFENVAYIGDDVNDLAIIKEAGFSACPADAVELVSDEVDFVCKKKGGEGVFRELAEYVLKAQGKENQA